MSSRVRCMWYDDDRNPLLGGCKPRGGTCYYSHPWQDEWRTAQRRQMVSVDRPAFSDPSYRSDKTRGDDQSNSRRAGPSTRDLRRPDHDDFDSTSWRPIEDPPNLTSSNNIALSQNRQRQDTSHRTAMNQASTSKLPPPTTGSGNSAFGAVSTSGDDGGWGSGGSWSASGSNVSGGLRLDNVWAGAEPDASKAASGHWDGPPPPKAYRTRSITPQPSKKSVFEDQHVPPPGPSRRQDLQLDTTVPLILADPGSAFPTPVLSITPISALSPTRFVPGSRPMTRSEIHTAIVRNTVRYIRIRMEFDEANEQLKRWRVTQKSAHFSRVSQSAGEQLNEISQRLSQRLAVMEPRLQKAKEDLLGLPDLPPARPILAAAEDELLRYMGIVETWLKRFTPAMEPPSSTAEPDAMLVDPPESPPQTTKVLYAEIVTRAEALETKLERLDDQLHESLGQNEISGKVRQMMQVNLKAKVEDPARSELDKAIQAAATKSTEAGQLVAQLIKSNADLQVRIDDLGAQKERRRTFIHRFEAQIDEFEKQRVQRETQLTLMRKQFAKMAAPIQPAVTAEIMEHTQLRVKEMIDREIVPALNAMELKYTSAIQRRMESLQQAIQPALDKTAEISERAKAME
ncbi:unnamed protein product [Mycena citricolor]|uniref:C3H1-type domain-containing protein n=1 Tax=Mycena citricolor TaxID=2018698 RepID=A0AAD2Q142_9AGAR|nr:unnamed protein product [Mycena citricolor]